MVENRNRCRCNNKAPAHFVDLLDLLILRVHNDLYLTPFTLLLPKELAIYIPRCHLEIPPSMLIVYSKTRSGFLMCDPQVSHLVAAPLTRVLFMPSILYCRITVVILNCLFPRFHRARSVSAFELRTRYASVPAEFKAFLGAPISAQFRSPLRCIFTMPTD